MIKQFQENTIEDIDVTILEKKVVDFIDREPEHCILAIKQAIKVQKGAIFLISIGPEKASKLLTKMESDEVERLTSEMSKTCSMTPSKKKDVLREVYDIAIAAKAIRCGGIEYAQEVLTRSFEIEEAMMIIERLKE